MEPRIENCPCRKKKCNRYGYCEACRAHHYAKGGLPYCERKPKKRKSK